MTAPAGLARRDQPRLRRGAVTWYMYLLLGFFTYQLNLQGNILPFLQAELELSYRAAGLHASAIAAGMILIGSTGERLLRWIGRRPALWLASFGVIAGAIGLCLAEAAWASITACGLIGAAGSLIPSLLPAVLAEAHAQHRDVVYAEATAISYAFGMLAPLATALGLALGVGWRGAVLAGALAGGLILLGFGNARVAEPAPPPETGNARLPAAYWAYWTLLALAVGIEYCILLWAPTFLAEAGGLSPALAALAAVAFPAAMLLGRTVGSGLIRVVAPPHLFAGALLLALLGFLLYWNLEGLAMAAGLAVLGLGIAPLYPLTISFAIGAAGAQMAAASARSMLAVGLAILILPALLGLLADAAGLSLAHLAIPVLMAAALACFAVARLLQRRRPSAKTGPLQEDACASGP